jgi:hypothetical protein
MTMTLTKPIQPPDPIPKPPGPTPTVPGPDPQPPGASGPTTITITVTIPDSIIDGIQPAPTTNYVAGPAAKELHGDQSNIAIAITSAQSSPAIPAKRPAPPVKSASKKIQAAAKAKKAKSKAV